MGLTSPGHNVLLSVLMGNVLLIRLKDIAPRADPKGVLIGADHSHRLLLVDGLMAVGSQAVLLNTVNMCCLYLLMSAKHLVSSNITSKWYHQFQLNIFKYIINF